MVANAVTRTMLFDFYGELLTEKQREYFDLHYNEDLSLTEIAELSGVSRQGIWDIIRRAELSMTETEQKTGLLSRFLDMRQTIEKLHQNSRALRALCDGQAAALCDQLIAGLDELII